MIAVRDHLAQFGDATVAVVTFATPERLRAYRDHLAVPFSILADVDRVLYNLVGAERGTNRQIWSLGTIRLYARLLIKGRRPTRPTEDIHQLGADLVVGRDGIVRFLALPSTPDSRPPISDLIRALD
ncbi:MAG: AhpC/TSA family protein [Ilumatobacteraceae bacterium]